MLQKTLFISFLPWLKPRFGLRLGRRGGSWILLLSCILLTGMEGASGENARETCDPARFEKERARMVQTQIRERGVEEPQVLEALRSVGRHCFVPSPLLDEAYADHPLPIGWGQTISQPYIVALMTELLKLKPSHRVLEIGTGSGYQTAVMAEIVRNVYSVEIHKVLATAAESRLAALGYKNIEIKCADGYYGWDAYAPFDAIMVTAAAGEIPPPLLKQLKPGGRMCIPVGGIYQVQQLTLVKKDDQGALSTRGVLPVRFVPLLGSH